MSVPRVALRRAPSSLLARLATAPSRVSASGCRHQLRSISQSASNRASSEKVQSTTSYQPYTLPSRPPTQPRNDPVPETSIASPDPLPRVHETRPLSHTQQPQTSSQSEAATTTPPQQTIREKSASATSSQLSEKDAQETKPVTSAPKPKRQVKFRPRKAAMKLTPSAVEHLREMFDQPEPQQLRVGVRNRGCSGLAYHLEWVEKPAAFDEEVEQDGVKVLIDSKALFSIIGSEMDWVEDKLNQRFVFRNPNIKEECGCGESFMV